MNSKSFTLNVPDLLILGKNALLVALASGLAFLGANLSEINLGPATAFVVPIVSVVIDTIVKWTKDNTADDTE